MTYTTNAAHDLIDSLHIQEAMWEGRVKKSKDAYERGLTQGYLDAMRFLLDIAPDRLAQVEAEARLVPEQDYPDVMTEAQRVVDELFPTQAEQFREFFMAGDVRDFPASDVA